MQLSLYRDMFACCEASVVKKLPGGVFIGIFRHFSALYGHYHTPMQFLGRIEQSSIFVLSRSFQEKNVGFSKVGDAQRVTAGGETISRVKMMLDRTSGRAKDR
jgi:hypothetical protein